MKKHTFGSLGPPVSELCLGTSNFTRSTSHEQSFEILDQFRAAGGNLFQTSGICPGTTLGDGFLGLPEELLGKWLRARQIPRNSVVIATRIAFSRPIIGGLETYTELIRQCAKDSVRRIGCRYLDLLVVEWTDAISPVRESMAAFAAVIRSRLVRRIVPANFPTWHVHEALAASSPAARAVAGVQLDYSLVTRSAFEAGAAKLCADHDLGFIARSPLARGHLAGRMMGAAALRQRDAEDWRAAMAADGIRPLLAATAQARRCSPAQIALAWVLNQPHVTSVLIRVDSVAQLRELVAATRLKLSAEESERLGGAGRRERLVTSLN